MKAITRICMKFGVVCSFFFFGQNVYGQFEVTAGRLKLGFDSRGSFTEIVNAETGKNYLAKDTAAPLLTLVSKGKKWYPSGLKADRRKQILQLSYPEAGVRLDVHYQQKASHLVFELIRAEPAPLIEAIIWGPVPNTIGETVGEIIGVVRDRQWSLGLQVLNVKTLGGDFPGSEGSTWARGIAAVPTKWGSMLQAYSINRDRPRRVDAWGGQYKNMPVAPIQGETVKGSKIAFFLCPQPETLDYIERIELAENLPHPTIKGEWFKRSSLFGKSYMISSFSESEVEEMIGYARQSGLVSLYHEGPFQSWGTFILDTVQFPNGRRGLKNCVDKAHAAGLLFGVHTLTNFINTNDPLVTPVPDSRLSRTGYGLLAGPIDARELSIPVSTTEYFNDDKGNSLHTVRIGSELIRYRAVTAEAPYRLLDCQRGAFGTRAAPHGPGDTVSKLMDHSYQVFFPDMSLQKQVAHNLASFLNETGVDHWDFDGHEGGLSTGQGDYGIELFSKEVTEQVTHDFLCGTSLSKTFYWHIGSYYNWGEPWYGGFRESMQQYRIDNQALFERNFMPHMMGWYLLAEHTSLAEMEWMLARAAGYRAGFAMVARPAALRKNPLTRQLLDAIREWEAARNANAFSPEQQEALRNPANEFHLEKVGEQHWLLSHIAVSPRFTLAHREYQPGEPRQTRWDFTQPWEEQPLQLQLNCEGGNGTVRNIRMQIDRYRDIQLPVELQSGESLVVDGSGQIRVYDANGKPKGLYMLEGTPPKMEMGTHTIFVDAVFSGDQAPRVHVQFKGRDCAEHVKVVK